MPKAWQHDVLRADGTPYDPAELDLIRRFAFPAGDGGAGDE
jgi:hypothetical protein